MNIKQDQYQPARDQVMVLVPNFKTKKETDSGIQLPDSVIEARAKEQGKTNFLEVVKVGPAVTEIKPGMRVLTSRLQELPVEANDEGYIVATIKEYDVIGYHEG